MATSVAACSQKAGTGDDAGPMLISDHGLLTVPAKSALRTHLVVEAVGGGAADRRVEAPAAVSRRSAACSALRWSGSVIVVVFL